MLNIAISISIYNLLRFSRYTTQVNIYFYGLINIKVNIYSALNHFPFKLID